MNWLDAFLVIVTVAIAVAVTLCFAAVERWRRFRSEFRYVGRRR